MGDFAPGGFDGSSRAAAVLKRQAGEASRLRRVVAEIVRNLICFAAEAENDCAGDVRVIKNSGENPAELIGIGPDGMSTPFAVRKRYDAVDVWRQAVIFIAGGD